VVEVCNQYESCSREVIKVEVIDLEPETDISALVEANIKAKNYQTLLNLITFSSRRNLIKNDVVSVDCFVILKKYQNLRIYSLFSSGKIMMLNNNKIQHYYFVKLKQM